MEIDISIDRESLTIPVENPFQLDLDGLVERVEAFVASKGIRLIGLDVKGLIPRMVRGIAGCERGCPADAKDFVKRGYKNFSLAYVEGGILTAKAIMENGKELSIKMFPDF